MTYTPPTHDILFTLTHVTGLKDLPEHPDLGALDADMVESILEPASKLAADVLAPLNHSGDQDGATLKDGVVTTAKGFKEAYAEYRDGGWNAVPFDPAFGGQGLPWLVAFAVQEMWQGANMSFGLCPLLNQGAVDAIYVHGSEDQKNTYLEKLISGEWTGTMNLTEPQAGSDLAQVRAKAEPQADGSYKISGQKIYITYGEHDLAENIIHLVLARLPDAPEGVKGISLFIVPKILVDPPSPDGSGATSGTRNDVMCTGLEHKLGIHASPTCTMQFGDQGGAAGYLVGQAHEGLKYMFTMMNNARLSVGLQGVAIAEAATQHALYYAKDRVQGAALDDKEAGPVTIDHHADVKRMILTMQALTQAGRMLTYEAALCLDLAHSGDAGAQAQVDLLTPIVKSWCTDIAQEVTSLGVQVHGGMGFVEETGAAQFMRDARILPIYEGTNGIQAMDLVFRKLLRDKGQGAQAYLDTMRAQLAGIKAHPDLEPLAEALDTQIRIVEETTHTLFAQAGEDINLAAAAATPYLSLWGIVAGGVMMGRAALAAKSAIDAGDGDAQDMERRIALAHFYMRNILPRAHGYAAAAVDGGQSVLAAELG